MNTWCVNNISNRVQHDGQKAKEGIYFNLQATLGTSMRRNADSNGLF